MADYFFPLHIPLECSTDVMQLYLLGVSYIKNLVWQERNEKRLYFKIQINFLKPQLE